MAYKQRSPIIVSEGGTGAETLTEHGIVLGQGTSALTTTAVGTNGQLVIGSSAADPVFGTLASTVGTVEFTTGAGTLALDVNDGLQTVTGWESWTGAGAYYDDSVLGDFELLRGGTGYIKSKPVTWAGGQTYTGMVAGNTYYIYIDDTGTIGATTAASESLYTDYIVLFECLRDSTPITNNQITVKENHPFDFPSSVSYYAHEVIGCVIENNDNGANITINGTQKIQINGDDVLSDHGLYTDIVDSAGVGVTWKQMYTTAAGKWALYQESDTFNGYFNSGGTPTVLTGNKYGVYRLYVSKDDLNSTDPTYFAVLNTAEFNNQAAADTAISNGSIAQATNELFNLEISQLGYIIYEESSSSIVEVIIEKATLKQTISTGGTNTAALITTNTTNFDGILSGADTNVQAALETIDDFGKDLTNNCVVVGNGNGNPLGVIGAGTTGELLVGATGADPAFANIAYGDFTFSNLTAATTASLGVTNGDSDATSHAELFIGTPDAAGDPYVNWQISGTTNYALGIDNSVAGDPIKLTNSSNPSAGDDLVTITSAGVISLFNALDVTEGGTGVTTLTSHGILLGNGAGDIQALAEATDGQIPIGSTGNNPVLATIISTGSSIAITNGAGSIDLDVAAAVATSYLADDANSAIPAANVLTVAGGTNIATTAAASTLTVSLDGTVGVANGGTGVSNPTDHSLLVGSGAAAMTELGVATDGQLVIGSSAADPVLATLTAGSGVSVTNAAGSITVATEQAGMSWSVVTTGQTAADSTGYFCNNAGGVTVTLPATASVGHTFEVCAMNAGGWTIAQNAGQQIFIGDDSTTAGVGGSLASTGIGDWVTLVCNVADTSWFCKTEQGNITVT